MNGLTLLEYTVSVPPGVTAEQYIAGATFFYQTNFTEPGIPLTLGSIEVLGIALNGTAQIRLFI